MRMTSKWNLRVYKYIEVYSLFRLRSKLFRDDLRRHALVSTFANIRVRRNTNHSLLNTVVSYAFDLTNILSSNAHCPRVGLM